MNRFYLIYLFLISTQFLFSQVGINTTTPSAASVLDVNSSSDGINFGGFMPPRVSLAERNTISVTAADDGLMVYLIDGNERCVQLWNGVDSTWDNVFCMPVNLAPVANNVQFSGYLIENEMLTVNFNYSDAEGDLAGSHVYTWYRADDNIGTNQTQVLTGTSNTYTLTSSEIGFYIAVEVSPVALTGTSPGISVLSIYQGVVNVPTIGGVFISEIADPNNEADARFVELYNGSNNPIDISGWNVYVYFNGSNTVGATYTLPNFTTLAAGNTYIIASNGTVFQNIYGFASDGVGFGFNSNGNETFELINENDSRIDIFGIVGTDGINTCAEFEDGRVLRLSAVIEGIISWDESEWQVWADSTINGCTSHNNSPQDAPSEFSPGSHPN
jgi:hypothetical protein